MKGWLVSELWGSDFLSSSLLGLQMHAIALDFHMGAGELSLVLLLAWAGVLLAQPSPHRGEISLYLKQC